MSCESLDGLCEECRDRELFERALNDHFNGIEGAILAALGTKRLRKHAHGAANRYLDLALTLLEDLYADLVGVE